MSLTHLLAMVAIGANGIAAGIMLSTVIGIVPMFLALPYGRYVQTVQFLRPRFDPVMPVTNGCALVLDVVLALTARPPGAVAAFAIAAALLASVMGVSITKNVPINRFIMSLDSEQQPEEWARIDPRETWRTWNLIRTSLALAAFITNVIAAVQLI
ncbi:MAG TPA: DUF1772 domain-containing protein [Streptosporangiaceae bacterium]|jgi:uncharacterized membrane protein